MDAIQAHSPKNKNSSIPPKMISAEMTVHHVLSSMHADTSMKPDHPPLDDAEVEASVQSPIKLQGLRLAP